MKAVLVAGGNGTRLESISKDLIPKPMVPLLGKPILLYQIENLKRYGVRDFYIIIGHLGSIIKNYFGDGKKYGINITYIVEDIPLGSGGSMFYLKEYIHDEDFYFVFGDLLIDVDFMRMLEFHKKNEALITLFVHPNSHPFDSDLLVLNNDNIVVSFTTKEKPRDYFYNNLVNSGISIISSKVLDYLTTLTKRDYEHDIVFNLLPTYKVYGYRSSEYVKDIGTPIRYHQAENDIQSGIVKAKNLSKKQRAIFLDRDGTINKYVGFMNDIEKFELLDGVAEAIRLINASEFLAIIISNQPVVARGEISFEGLEDINKKMETLLGNEGAYLDAIYYCPHHPDKGYEGEVKELKISCDCRKPKIGLLLKAKERFNIDLSESIFIGDTDIDVLTGKNAGCKKSIKTESLLKAVKEILYE